MLSVFYCEIKYWLVWFESLLVFILFKFKKTSQHFRNSGFTCSCASLPYGFYFIVPCLQFFWCFSHSIWQRLRFLAVSSWTIWERSNSNFFSFTWLSSSATLLSELSCNCLNLDKNTNTSASAFTHSAYSPSWKQWKLFTVEVIQLYNHSCAA